MKNKIKKIKIIFLVILTLIIPLGLFKMEKILTEKFKEQTFNFYVEEEQQEKLASKTLTAGIARVLDDAVGFMSRAKDGSISIYRSIGNNDSAKTINKALKPKLKEVERTTGESVPTNKGFADTRVKESIDMNSVSNIRGVPIETSRGNLILLDEKGTQQVENIINNKRIDDVIERGRTVNDKYNERLGSQYNEDGSIKYVATGSRSFVEIADAQKIEVLDPATGNVIRTIDITDRMREANRALVREAGRDLDTRILSGERLPQENITGMFSEDEMKFFRGNKVEVDSFRHVGIEGDPAPVTTWRITRSDGTKTVTEGIDSQLSCRRLYANTTEGEKLMDSSKAPIKFGKDIDGMSNSLDLMGFSRSDTDTLTTEVFQHHLRNNDPAKLAEQMDTLLSSDLPISSQLRNDLSNIRQDPNLFPQQEISLGQTAGDFLKNTASLADSLEVGAALASLTTAAVYGVSSAEALAAAGATTALGLPALFVAGAYGYYVTADTIYNTPGFFGMVGDDLKDAWAFITKPIGPGNPTTPSLKEGTTSNNESPVINDSDIIQDLEDTGMDSSDIDITGEDIVQDLPPDSQGFWGDEYQRSAGPEKDHAEPDITGSDVIQDTIPPSETGETGNTEDVNAENINGEDIIQDIPTSFYPGIVKPGTNGTIGKPFELTDEKWKEVTEIVINDKGEIEIRLKEDWCKILGLSRGGNIKLPSREELKEILGGREEIIKEATKKYKEEGLGENTAKQKANKETNSWEDGDKDKSIMPPKEKETQKFDKDNKTVNADNNEELSEDEQLVIPTGQNKC